MSHRLSRWSDEPRVRNGKVRAVKPSQREIEFLFPILERYPALPAHYIHALMGERSGNLDYLADRLPLLACKPNCYLVRHPAQRENADANYRHQVYSHADRPLSNFWHDLMASMVMSQIELGARQAGLDYAGFDRILAKAPQELRSAKRPETVTITVKSEAGKERTVRITPDWTPFGVGSRGKFRFYFGIEADCHTETIRAGSLHHASIRRKLIEYLLLNEQKVAQKVYNLPGPFYFPFVFDLQSRVESARQLLFDITDGKGSPYFLFNFFPSYNSFEKPPRPDGAFFHSAWNRAWASDFRMEQP